MTTRFQSSLLASVIGTVLLLAGCGGGGDNGEKTPLGPNAVFWGTYSGNITGTIDMPPLEPDVLAGTTTQSIGSDSSKKDEPDYLFIPSSEQTAQYVVTASNGDTKDVTVTISSNTINVDTVGPMNEIIGGPWISHAVYEFSSDYEVLAYTDNETCPPASGSITTQGTLTRISTE